MTMTDMHCHLLFGVDDGVKTIDESVTILRDMYEYGYRDVILTPHYIGESNYSSPKSENKNRLRELRQALSDNNIPINLYLGNEIFIDYNILDLLNKGIISSLNDTNYLLIELPMSGEFEGYIDVFRNLINSGYKVILAHPERYHAFQNDFDKVYELDKIGVLFQSNVDSLVGNYGKHAMKMMKKLLKAHLVSFLATDIHHRKHDYGKWDDARKKALKYISNEEYERLISKNPSVLISECI